MLRPRLPIAEVAKILGVHEKLARAFLGSDAYHEYAGGPLVVKQSALKDYAKALPRTEQILIRSRSALSPRSPVLGHAHVGKSLQRRCG